MTSKIVFTVTAPDGTVLKRTTTGNEYSHAVIDLDGRGKWCLVSCHSRLDLARIVAARKPGSRILPMVRTEKTLKAMDPRKRLISTLRRQLTASRNSLAEYEEKAAEFHRQGHQRAAEIYESRIAREREWIAGTEARLEIMLKPAAVPAED